VFAEVVERDEWGGSAMSDVVLALGARGAECRSLVTQSTNVTFFRSCGSKSSWRCVWLQAHRLAERKAGVADGTVIWIA
jgi:hypothetical protein